jgi:hypothetical protein
MIAATATVQEIRVDGEPQNRSRALGYARPRTANDAHQDGANGVKIDRQPQQSDNLPDSHIDGNRDWHQHPRHGVEVFSDI